MRYIVLLEGGRIVMKETVDPIAVGRWGVAPSPKEFALRVQSGATIGRRE